MKRLFLAIGIVCFLGACDNFNQHSTVTNNSSRQISFQWGKANPAITLNSGESSSISGGYGEVNNLYPEKRVFQKYEGGAITNWTITIYDIIPYEVRVENTLSYPITLTANGWMDDMIDIQSGWADDTNHKGLIYTDSPQFTVESDTFSIKTDYQFTNDIFYVKIY